MQGQWVRHLILGGQAPYSDEMTSEMRTLSDVIGEINDGVFDL